MENFSLIGPKDAFAPEAAAPTWFSVKVDDRGRLPERAVRKIIFHGINKSGSLCLTKVLMDAFAAEGRANQFHSHYHADGVGLSAFRSMVDSTPAPAFFVGHQLFGSVGLTDPDAIMFTQFRHPLPRMMSCYEWLKKKHCIQNGSAEGFDDFETFIRKGGGKSHSQIAQFGAGYGTDRNDLLKTLTRSDLLARSQENVARHTAFAGIAELFEETIFVAAHLCGIGRVSAWKRDERNTGRPLVWTLPKPTIALVEDVYRYDFELYEWAKRRFENLLSDVTIRGEIDAYRLACAPAYKDRLGAA